MSHSAVRNNGAEWLPGGGRYEVGLGQSSVIGKRIELTTHRLMHFALKINILLPV